MDDEMTPEEFDAAFESGTPVELNVSRLTVVTLPDWMRVTNGPRTWAASTSLTITG